MRNRMGIPISLTVLHMAVGRRAGLQVREAFEFEFEFEFE